jgi:hypothetical protein
MVQCIKCGKSRLLQEIRDLAIDNLTINELKINLIFATDRTEIPLGKRHQMWAN